MTTAYDRMPHVAALNAVVVKNVEAFTAVVDMSRHMMVAAVLGVGDIPAEGVVFRCVACDSNGANPTATLTGKTMTIVANASTNDNTQYVINLSAAQLAQLQPTKQFVKFGVVTDAATGGPMSIHVYSNSPRYGAGSTSDSASVVTVV